MAKRLYVGNLKYTVTSEQLQEMFEQFGAVSSAQVLSDRETGRSRGFGFVEMVNDAEAEAAIESLDGQDHDGRRLTVNEARPRTPGGGRRAEAGAEAAAIAVAAAAIAVAAATAATIERSSIRLRWWLTIRDPVGAPATMISPDLPGHVGAFLPLRCASGSGRLRRYRRAVCPAVLAWRHRASSWFYYKYDNPEPRGRRHDATTASCSHASSEFSTSGFGPTSEPMAATSSSSESIPTTSFRSA